LTLIVTDFTLSVIDLTLIVTNITLSVIDLTQKITDFTLSVTKNGRFEAKLPRNVKITLKLSGQKATVAAGQKMLLSGKPKVSPEG
jgi:hypothetical protein